MDEPCSYLPRRDVSLDLSHARMFEPAPNGRELDLLRPPWHAVKLMKVTDLLTLPPAAAKILERVVNRQRVIVNETVRTLGDTVSVTKKSLHIMGGRTAASQRSDLARIKIVR